MTISRRTHVPSLSTLSYAACLFAVASFLLPAHPQAQDGPPPPSAQAANGAVDGWHSDEAVHLIGLPDIKEKQKGLLSISPKAMTFSSPQGSATVQRSEISSVIVGDVRVEMGGTAGKFARAVIPFGGGAAIATVTNKQVSLLTIEFRDQRDALHGVVFLLPKNEALLAKEQLGPQAVPMPAEETHGRCEASGTAQPDTIKVTAIATQGEPVPAEYRVLLYEQLLHRLREEGTFTAIYRDGDDSLYATCPGYTLTLTVDAFKKGNAAVRASTGPLGLFVATTSLKFHVQVEALNGSKLLDKDIGASQRGDSDSLNVTDKIAKSLTKDLKKASLHDTRS